MCWRLAEVEWLIEIHIRYCFSFTLVEKCNSWTSSFGNIFGAQFHRTGLFSHRWSSQSNQFRQHRIGIAFVNLVRHVPPPPKKELKKNRATPKGDWRKRLQLLGIYLRYISSSILLYRGGTSFVLVALQVNTECRWWRCTDCHSSRFSMTLPVFCSIWLSTRLSLINQSTSGCGRPVKGEKKEWPKWIHSLKGIKWQGGWQTKKWKLFLTFVSGTWLECSGWKKN